MRVMNFVLAAALCSGVALFAGSASASRIDTTYGINDSDDPNNNFCQVQASGTSFQTFGDVTGIGTGGDAVEIEYSTNEPTSASANDNTAKVKQNNDSSICFFIDSTDVTRDLAVCSNPSKCDVAGSVNAKKLNGEANAHCGGDNIYAVMTPAQVASIQTAFNGNKRVKIKVNSDNLKGSIDIKCKGTAFDED
jgi:hypothetical protein